jgi:hypothetical protein
MSTIANIGTHVSTIGTSQQSYWTSHFPSDLTIDIVSDSQIDLSWVNHGSSSFSYIIIEKSFNSYTWFEKAAVAPGVSTYTDTDVTAYTTTYYYRVRYVNVSASSDIPALVSAIVENLTPTKLRLVYNNILDYASVPTTTDFTVIDHTISSVVIAGYTVTLTLSTPVIYFDILKVSYVVPANNKLRIMNGGNAAALINQVITNNIAEDGNTVAWYDSTDLTTITKDGSNRVSSWGDKLGDATKAILQAGADAIKPVWSETGILFDGSNDFMKSADFGVILQQPTFLYAVINFKSFTINDIVFDGLTTGWATFKNSTTGVATIGVSAGTEKWINVVAADQRVIIRILFRNTTSSLQVNDHAIAENQNLGINNMRGVTLARAGTSGSAYGHVEFQELILRKTADSVITSDSLMNYLKTKYSVPL